MAESHEKELKAAEPGKSGFKPILTQKRPPKVITLPSGKVASCSHGTGLTLMNAQRVVGIKNADDTVKLVFALIAQLVTIDGRAIVFEDLLEMDLLDVLALQGEVLGENFAVAGLPVQ